MTLSSYCYIEKGLAGYVAQIAAVLVPVLRYQRHYGYSNSSLFMATFGGEQDELRHHPSLIKVRNIENSLEMAQVLCTLSGQAGVPPTSPAVIKTLFPRIPVNYTNFGPPRGEDMLLFFHSTQEVLMAQRTQLFYSRFLKSHSVWFTFDWEAVNVQVGKSILPALSAVSQS